MEPLSLTLPAWDGLPLRVLTWDGGDRGPPVLCLPGLVRTAGDYAAIAPALAASGRRVVALDYAGRGGSGRSRDVNRYAPEPCLRDVMDVCAALHLGRVSVIGTSFGGLLAMALAAARPAMLRSVVLNDIGPDIGAEGEDFVRRFVALDPALGSVEACVAFLKEHLPPLSLHTDEDWRTMVTLTYEQGADGRFHPVWDTAIARLLTGPKPDLWPLFGALSPLPVLLVRGGVSTLLSAETATAMAARHPALTLVTVPGVGHAPTLAEDAVREVLMDFLR